MTELKNRIIDRSGIRYGMLTAVEIVGRDKYRNVLWKCLCDCGEIVVADKSKLSGKNPSCGCVSRKQAAPREDLTGHVFGRLTVMELADTRGNSGDFLWKCKCQCGEEAYREGGSLRAGLVNSCGCLRKEARTTTHGMSKEKVYQVHNKMKVRCDDLNNKSFADYGGRGITYDPKWKNFEGFWEDMGSTYVSGLTIDRIDVNGNYCKENCRWLPKARQSQGTRKRKDKWTSKYKGVALQPSGLWLAQIQKDGIVCRGGPFVAEIDAAISYDKMAVELYGDTATTNYSLGLLENHAI